MVDEELRQILVHDDKVTSNRSDSSEDDINRHEMLWESRHENYLMSIKNYCLDKSDVYDKGSHSAKKKYNGYSIPVIVLPLVLSVINPYLGTEYEIVNSAGMALVSILTGLNTFLNHGKKVEKFNALRVF